MSNPLFKTGKTDPNSSSSPHDKVTEQHVQKHTKRSYFPLSSPYFTSARYGEIFPFLCKQTVPGDSFKLRPSVEVRSDTLSSPLMTGISIKQQYAYIPYPALIPRAYDYVFRDSATGDTAPDDAMPSISLTTLDKYLRALLSVFVYQFGHETVDQRENDRLITLCLISHFFSSGGLLRSLGYNFRYFLDAVFTSAPNTHVRDFDQFFDIYCSILSGRIESENAHVICTYNLDGKQYRAQYTAQNLLPAYATDIVFENSAEFLRFVLSKIKSGAFVSLSNLPQFPEDLQTLTMSLGSIASSQPADDIIDMSFDNLSLAPLFGYHGFVTQFCVNTKVDKVYTFDIWQSNMLALMKGITDIDFGNDYFLFNGSQIFYDYLSGHYYEPFFEDAARMLNIYITTAKTSNYMNVMPNHIHVLMNLFELHHALLYGDRISNGRVSAIGAPLIDSNLDTSTGSVESQDISLSVIMYKIKNKISRLGNSASNQLKGFFGVDTPPDYHYPQYIGSGISKVGTFEVANTTSEDAGYQVTRINSSAGSSGFSLDVSFHGILIGVASFVAPFVRKNPMERHCFLGKYHDLYNPDYQLLGDDALHVFEVLGYFQKNMIDSVYSYENRDLYYKVPIPRAAGAFTSSLRSWAFVGDSDYPDTPDLRKQFTRISSEALRCIPQDFDRFFISLPYFSDANYYHFICKFNNDLSSKREMIKSPSILLG